MRDSHTFVVPTFGEPEWLERCLGSLQEQTVRSAILLTTSTPNGYVRDVARRCGVCVSVNPVSGDIASDWNFAYGQATSEWVTLAHQDDTYAPEYVARCLSAADLTREPNLVFTGAHESCEPGGPLAYNVRFKRAIAGAVFLGREAIASPRRKRLLLAFGNPIPCPSVMLNKFRLTGFQFPEGWKSNLDWRAWVDLAARPGAFVYVRDALVQRTLHAAAATTQHLAERAEEDARMFAYLWPRAVARAISVLYAGSRAPYQALRNKSGGSARER